MAIRNYLRWMRESLKSTNAAASPRRHSSRLQLECLESRTLLSIVFWNNRGTCTAAPCSPVTDSDQFFARYGANAGRARAVITAALSTWESTIQNFNYRNVGQQGWASIANLYSVSISAANLTVCGGVSGNFLGCGGADRVDPDGRPFRGVITLDDNGAGTGWYFDASPTQHGEFTTLLNRFAALGPMASTDLYSVALHEIGHALGFSMNDGLRINGRISDPDLSPPYGALRVFTFVDGSRASLNGGHTWDTATPAGYPSHPNDLMNPSIGPSERRLVSDLDARILRDGYGYTITLPSTRETFLTTYDSATRVLTLNGDPQVLNDTISIDVGGGTTLFATVDGIVSRWAVSAVDRIVVNAGAGNDIINIEQLPGSMPVTVNGDSGNDTINLSPFFKNQDTLQLSRVTVNGGIGTDTLNVFDDNSTASRIYAVTSTSVGVGIVTRATYNSSTENLQVSASSGAGTTVNLQSTAAATAVTRAAVVNVGNPTNGVQDIRGSVNIQNLAGRQTTLHVNDTGNTAGRTATQSLPGAGFGIISGLAPATINYRLSQTGAVTITLGGGADTFTVENTDTAGLERTTLNAGPGADRINVWRTTGPLTVNGGLGDDTISLGSNDNRLDGLFDTATGSVTIDGEGGTDTVLQRDNGTTAARSYNFTSRWIQKGALLHIYDNVEAVTFSGGSGGNALQVGLGIGAFTHALTVHAGTGVDTIGVSGLARISGRLTVNGQGGTDTLTLDDRSLTTDSQYSISADSLTTGAMPSRMDYSGVENLVLHAGSGVDIFSVFSTAAGTTTTLNGGAGGDAFVFGEPDASGLAGTVNFDGQAGNNFARLNDSGVAVGRSYTWIGNTLGFGTAAFTGVNLDYFYLYSGLADDTVQIQGVSSVYRGVLDSGGTDTLLGRNVSTTWALTTLDAGSFLDFEFYNVENLVGGSDDDAFVFADGAGVSGTINGGGGNNTLDYTAWTTGVYVDLLNNIAFQGAAAVLNIVYVFGGSGDDFLHGDAQGNWIVGNAGHDILVGDEGGDWLQGGEGADQLYGGNGFDQLDGGNGEDLLFGGPTAYDNDVTALSEIWTEWTRTDLLYADRIAVLRTGTPSGYLLDATTVFEDIDADLLNGEGDLDWFWGTDGFDIMDRADPDEVLN